MLNRPFSGQIPCTTLQVGSLNQINLYEHKQERETPGQTASEISINGNGLLGSQIFDEVVVLVVNSDGESKPNYRSSQSFALV